MNEEQLRDRLHATADNIDPSPVPHADIYASGHAIARRRTGVRVVVGVAATIIAAVGVAVSAPASSPTDTNTDLATATTTADSSTSKCPGDLVEAADAAGPLCVSPSGTSEPWPGPGGLKQSLEIELLSASPAQRQAFGDNQVTQVEHRLGFERFRGCLAGEGFELTYARITPLGVEYGVPAEAVDSGVDESCYLRHYKALEMAWEIPRADQILNDEVLRAVNRCLTRNGADPGADVIEATQRMRDAGLSEEQCGLSLLSLGAPLN